MLLCEALSGIREKRNGVEPEDEYSRYRFFNRHETTANLKFLNLADLKSLTNKAMKSISFNLFPNLCELSIWGCYRITNEGFLELCTAHKSDSFRRVNYCGCYKISDDSRLWISSSFSRVIIYNKVDEFGKDINYDEIV
jgi:antirestriction protein